jgi:hypothetical protein
MAPVAVIPAAVVAITERAITIVTPPVVIPVAPVRTVVSSIVSISRKIIVVRIEVVIHGSVNGRDWNGESKGKADTGARRRFREKRQTSDHKSEDNELLHNKRDEEDVPADSRNSRVQCFTILAEGTDGALGFDAK